MKINANLWRSYSDVKFDFKYQITLKNYAIITAWNPKSEKLSHYENCVNNQRLQNELKGYDWSLVYVGDSNFDWYEESFAVAIPLELALHLGRLFQQNAIYYVSQNQLYLYSCIGHQYENLGDLHGYKLESL